MIEKILQLKIKHLRVIRLARFLWKSYYLRDFWLIKVIDMPSFLYRIHEWYFVRFQIYFLLKKRCYFECMALSVRFIFQNRNKVYLSKHKFCRNLKVRLRLIHEGQTNARSERKVEIYYHNNMRNQIKTSMVRIVGIYANFLLVYCFVTPLLKEHHMVATLSC